MVKLQGEFAGCPVNSNGEIILKFKFELEELSSSIQTSQYINEDIRALMLVEYGSETYKLKINKCSFKKLTIASDGKSNLELSSLLEYIDLNILKQLIHNKIKIKLGGLNE
jgi:hypothetical protein